jgi:hypothetical protein
LAASAVPTASIEHAKKFAVKHPGAAGEVALRRQAYQIFAAAPCSGRTYCEQVIARPRATAPGEVLGPRVGRPLRRSRHNRLRAGTIAAAATASPTHCVVAPRHRSRCVRCAKFSINPPVGY